ncbi:MAG: hypothetical protein P4N59_04650 [Negativicutes bacterium]|nr:hypothetical protein [Negativicutes bacterium]
MRPDVVVETLERDWEIKTTRRTVLTYETEKIITPPFFETGKAKEYPETVVAEFVASWGLIHGEYGLKPSKVAEVRKYALQVLYDYGSIWKQEIKPIQDLSISQVIDKGERWSRPFDFFAYAWIMLRQGVIWKHRDEELKQRINTFIKTGRLSDIPMVEIETVYFVEGDKFIHTGINLTALEFLSFSKHCTITAVLQGGSEFPEKPPKVAKVIYSHPEDLVLQRPVIE